MDDSEQYNFLKWPLTWSSYFTNGIISYVTGIWFSNMIFLYYWSGVTYDWEKSFLIISKIMFQNAFLLMPLHFCQVVEQNGFKLEQKGEKEVN